MKQKLIALFLTLVFILLFILPWCFDWELIGKYILLVPTFIVILIIVFLFIKSLYMVILDILNDRK